MKTDFHSIWLMPSGMDEDRFSRIVRDLAKRFDSPVFQPHLTLVEDMPRGCEELKPTLEKLADGMTSFEASVEAVEESSLYYRSFYARFPVIAPLRMLKEKAVRLFGVGSIETFMPHISLAYGVPESPEKIAAILELQRGLQGVNVSFDRVCIVSSSQQTPIEEWTIRASASLA
jgi:2'-5' RNA ligase